MVQIVFTGGGTGGHIFPIIAVLRELKRQFSAENLKCQFAFIGPGDSFAPVLFFNEQVPTYFIAAGKLRRYFSVQNFIDIFKIPLGILQALWRLWVMMPDIVFSKGGYGSFPVVVAAWLYRIPIVLHESDAVPGLANKILARFANKIAVSFEGTAQFPLSKTIVTGNPIRAELFLQQLNGQVPSTPSTGSRQTSSGQVPISLSPERKTILIIGGSQGAARINDFTLSVLPMLLLHYQVIHQCGEQNFDAVRRESNAILNAQQKPLYTLTPFFQEAELNFVYFQSNLIVARAGSGSVFEIAQTGKPSILIPISDSAQNHQSINASAYAAYGAAIVLEENNLTPNLFMEKVREILDNDKVYATMSKAALSFAKPNAANDIAREIILLIR